jgi:hypothetical protein
MTHRIRQYAGSVIGHRRPAAALLALALLAAWPGSATAQTDDSGTGFNKGGRTSMQFLKIGVGARQAALGEAGIALVRDVNSVFWNPANITAIGRTQVSFSYTRWIADMNYVGGAFGFRLGNIGSFALSAASLDYGAIPEATVGGGSNDARTGSTFDGADLLFGLSYARSFNDRLSIGLTVKYMRETLWNYAAGTWAFDVGTNYDIGAKGLRLAMSAQNFGGSVSWLEDSSQIEGFDIPFVFRVGLSSLILGPAGDSFVAIPESHQVRLSVEAINSNDYSERLHFGLEYLFNDLLALRSGYRFNHAEGNLSLGFGLQSGFGRSAAVAIDYAYVAHEYLDAPHRFSLTVSY